jgi:2-succinyl-5-enolpyruvyl-6-hydroxy-3-cyclohexene-1-carboxylate synthase
MMTERAIYRARKYAAKYDAHIIALRWKYTRAEAIKNYFKVANAHALVDEWLTDLLKDQYVQRGERDRVEQYIYQWMTSNENERQKYVDEIRRWGEINSVDPNVIQQIIDQLPTMAVKVYNYITSYQTEYEIEMGL